MLVMMCGLPASGKTTSAMLLHHKLGGLLIRSCDIYETLGIVVPDWVRRTKGFTVNLSEYDRLRDEAYAQMWLRVDKELAVGTTLIIVDFAHPDLDKRHTLYTICLDRGAVPVIVLCQCDDFEEVRRRFSGRRGREGDPEHEASDLSIFDDIRRRWQSPVTDLLANGRPPTIIMYDTMSGAVTPVHVTVPDIAEKIRGTLEIRRSEEHLF